MRNLRILLSIAVLALLACACLPDVELPLQPKGNHLTATISTGPVTRTTLAPEVDGASKVLWSENDRIGVFVDEEPNMFLYQLTAGAGTGRAVFSGYGTGDSYIAVYPSAFVTGLGVESVSLTLPAEQTWHAGTASLENAPMVAVSNTSELSFRNVCSLLKISMTGHHSVTSLVFRPNDGSIKVAGPATVSLANADEPVLTVSSRGCDSLVLNTGGVMLNDETPTDFYLALPPQTYRGGFTVRVNTSTGYMDKTLSSDFTMERARKHNAKSFAVKLDVGVEPSAFLEGQGTEKDPFLIASLGDLLYMQGAVNADETIGESKVKAAQAYYCLTGDIDLSPLCGKQIQKNWEPIGNEGHPFAGHFDGNGHAIRNLYIHDGNKDYVGLFGKAVRGTEIHDLTVEGDVYGRNNVALVAGQADAYFVNDIFFTRCVSQGRVEASGSYAAGIAGTDAGAIDCVNRADVFGNYGIGGILGVCWCVSGCVNYGNITGLEYNDYAGGITGYMIGSYLTDCWNEGTVKGKRYVGGVCGYIRQRSVLYNCYNKGSVSGDLFVGGVCGCCSNNSGGAVMDNCFNVGEVRFSETASDPQFIGSVAGYNGAYWDYEFEYGYTNPMIRNCYWLYDEGKNLGMQTGIGEGNGEQENNYPLTDDQMRTTLLGLLNERAYYLQQTTKRGLHGWSYEAGDSAPHLTDLEVQKPGADNAVFRLSENSFSFLVNGGSFTVSVTSSLDYSVGALPDWITAEPVQTQEMTPHTHRHTFTVAKNDAGVQRQADIVFTNAEGSTLNVKVSQAEPYLRVSLTELSFADSRSSKRIAVESSLDWVTVCGSDPDWFSVSPQKGYGDGGVSVLVEDNPRSAARAGSFVIAAADGSVEYVINVVQSGNQGGAVGDWEALPFYHQSLAMRFTATWCGWCPVMHTSITRAQQLYPGKILHLALHGTDSELIFSPTGTLMSQYRTNAFPTGIVDGRIRVANDTDNDAAAACFIAASKETEETYGTVSGMAIRSVSAGRTVEIDIDAYFKVAGDYKITVLLLEDGIVWSQAGGSDEYVHDAVARVTATNIKGDSFRVDDDLSTRAFHYSVAVPVGQKIENMRVLAYIQKTFGAAPRIQSDDYGDYYVDNCATVPVGEMLKLALVGGDGGSGGGSGGGGEEIIPGSEIK
ncbi:MAG: Omp28-related outer membrane protein [Bacteroidales bacterium]|nr:Omp28-related outer membrane protein [Bacteroidales bacterium]